MKKYLPTMLIATAIAGCVLLNETKTVAQTIDTGWVSVQTEANTEIAPDVVEIKIEVKIDDTKSLQKATDDNKEITEKIYTELSAMIDQEKGDFIKTKNFNATPIYSYKNEKKSIIK